MIKRSNATIAGKLTPCFKLSKAISIYQHIVRDHFSDSFYRSNQSKQFAQLRIACDKCFERRFYFFNLLGEVGNSLFIDIEEHLVFTDSQNVMLFAPGILQS